MAIFSNANRRQQVDNNYANNDYNTGNSTMLGRNTNGVATNNYDNRNNYQDGHNTGLSSHHNEKRAHRTRSQRAGFDINSGEYNRRPGFGQWIKFTWLDLLTMLVMGAIALGVYFARPAPSRVFPVTFANGDTVMPQFGYPVRHEIFPIWSAVLLSVFVPIIIILCMQARIKSFWDANNAIMGLMYAIISAALFQVFVKWLIGGLAPNFLSVCQPDAGVVIDGGLGFNSGMYQRSVCLGHAKGIHRALESFPSGQSTVAFAGFLFLYFYLNAKMKVFSNHHPAMWKLIVLYIPILAATLIALSATIDEYHHWYDILVGAIIGSIFALSAYRMVYASVWDFRFNHIPLTRHTPFSYGAGRAGAGGFESAVFTRTAGWGFEEAYGGAPFDAAHGLRGQTAGFNQGAAGLNHGSGMMGQRRDGDIENDRLGHHNRNSHHAAEAAVGGAVLGGAVGRHEATPGHHHQSSNLTGQNTTHDNRNSGLTGHNNVNQNSGVAGDYGNTGRHHNNHQGAEAAAGAGILGGILGSRKRDRDHGHHNSGITGHSSTNDYQDSNMGTTHNQGTSHQGAGGGMLGGLLGGHKRDQNLDPAYDNRNTGQRGLTTGYDNTSSNTTGYNNSNNTGSTLHHNPTQPNPSSSYYNTTTTTTNVPQNQHTTGSMGGGVLSSVLPGHHNSNTNRDNVQYATEPYSRSNTYNNTQANTGVGGTTGYNQSGPQSNLERKSLPNVGNTGSNANYNNGTNVTNY